jgi:hypothetical protein
MRRHAPITNWSGDERRRLRAAIAADTPLFQRPAEMLDLHLTRLRLSRESPACEHGEGKANFDRKPVGLYTLKFGHVLYCIDKGHRHGSRAEPF